MESPCSRCKNVQVVHTDDDLRPLCDPCLTAVHWLGVLRDITEGKLEISDELLVELGASEALMKGLSA